MAKLNKSNKPEEQLVVDETAVEVTATSTTEEVDIEDTTTSDSPVVTVDEEQPEVSVDHAVMQVNENNIPPAKEQNVRVRMARDHHCVIAMERYDLYKGQCYVVSPNVKRILNDAGLLAPL